MNTELIIKRNWVIIMNQEVIDNKIERIKEGKHLEIKNYFKSYVGFVPESVWEIDFSKNKLLNEFVQTQAEVVEEKYKQYNIPKDTRLNGLTLSSRSVRDGISLSIFPFDLAQKILRFYSTKNDVIFDPFSGHLTRWYCCYLNDRHYFGYDISKLFFEKNSKILKNLISQSLSQSKPKINLYNKDSRHLHFPNNSFDLIFTSPPYYDLEFYGDEQGQLGNCKDYISFLDDMRQIVSECYRVLKPDKFIVFNVNDFVKEGIFYPYHCDIIRIFEDIGFKLHDVVIVDWQTSIGKAFVTEIFERKKTAKRHEYLIVAKKVSNEMNIFDKELLLKLDFEKETKEKETEEKTKKDDWLND